MRFFQAEAIFDGQNFLEKGSILVLNDKNETQDVLPSNALESSRVQKFNGLLCPGFVNAHCHLELSHLKGLVPKGIGLPEFGKAIISKRGKFAVEEAEEHMNEADRFMWEKGIVAVGDISNNSTSFRTKAQSKIKYHTFVELLGLHPSLANEVMKQGKALLQEASQFSLKASLSPHAPYSVSEPLLEEIKIWCEENALPYTIHNQESEEEHKFLTGEKSGFDGLYQYLNMDLSWYKAPGRTGLIYLKKFLPKHLSLLVHNTLSTARDLELAADLNNFWCFCPRANVYIEDRLPDFNLFQPQLNKICLGTDSLASNDNLDVLQEANVLLETGCFESEHVLRMLCSQGAEALGLSGSFGSLVTGKNTGVNLLERTQKQLRFIKKIV
jgi:aminodeoxyfutalosine deaminase